jgi:hypothetical protein
MPPTTKQKITKNLNILACDLDLGCGCLTRLLATHPVKS